MNRKALSRYKASLVRDFPGSSCEAQQTGADRKRARSDGPSPSSGISKGHRTRRYGDRGSEDESRELPGMRSRSRSTCIGTVPKRGMTVLEVMVVLAIIGGASVLVRSGFRVVTKADLVENATELAAILRRTSALSIEHGELHRVVFDFDKHGYSVEVCRGETAIQRNEKARRDARDEEEVRRAQDRAKDALQTLPPDPSQSADPEEANRRAAALSGQHIADRVCSPATDTFSGDAQGRGWVRALRSQKGIRLKEIWVAHRDESATKDEVAIYFFPTGRSEKAVIELTDGSETFSILVFGLTGRVELKDGPLKDVNDHMMRNALGEKDAARDS